MESRSIAAATGTPGFRRVRLRACRRSAWLTLLLALPVCLGFSQQGSSAGAQLPTTPRHGFPQTEPEAAPLSSIDSYNPVESEKRIHMINVERQKSLVADTDKLLGLVTELNNEIAKANTGDLSPAQLRKVEEIEKLARSVKEKMVMSLRGPTLNMDGPPFLPTLH